MNIFAGIRLLRPRQWLKNLMLFFPPFLSGALFHPGLLQKGAVPLLAFCCASSAGYIFNDLRDLEQDRYHPRKSLRPLASGEVSRRQALLLLGGLLTGALLAGWRVSPVYLYFVSLYLLLSAVYSLYLKHLPIFDVFCISLGFVLRLYAGGEAFCVYVSDWLFLSVFLLSIFLSVGKRYSECRNLGEAAVEHRRALGSYPEGFLESAMYLSGATVLMTYAMYVMTTPLLVYTVPLCVFGLLRYLLRIKAGGEGDPAEALLKDGVLLGTGIIWVLLVGLSVYR